MKNQGKVRYRTFQLRWLLLGLPPQSWEPTVARALRRCGARPADVRRRLPKSARCRQMFTIFIRIPHSKSRSVLILMQRLPWYEKYLLRTSFGYCGLTKGMFEMFRLVVGLRLRHPRHPQRLPRQERAPPRRGGRRRAPRRAASRRAVGGAQPGKENSIK